jgi:hypothetical protein
MEKVLAKQRIIYYQFSAHVEELILPPHPSRWWHPKGAVTNVEMLGVDKPSEELINEAEFYGWKYCEYDGRFYPL